MKRPDTFCQVDALSMTDDIGRLSFSDVVAARDTQIVLFTPALLITHGRFDRDPVIEFDARFPAPAEQRPFYTELTRDNEHFFSGLGAHALATQPGLINWDRRLYCVPASRAEECFAFIGGIAFSDPKTGFFGHTFSYDLNVPDPTSSRRQTLAVRVFGVATNTYISFLAARTQAQPRVVTVPVSGPEVAAQFLMTRGIISTLTADDPLSMRD